MMMTMIKVNNCMKSHEHKNKCAWKVCVNGEEVPLVEEERDCISCRMIFSGTKYMINYREIQNRKSFVPFFKFSPKKIVCFTGKLFIVLNETQN